MGHVSGLILLCQLIVSAAAGPPIAPPAESAPAPGVAPAAPQEEQRENVTVARIAIEGNRRIPTETILTYVTLAAGDRYDERLLRNDFRALWNTGWFSNLRILRSDDAAGAVVVTIAVEELPLVREVRYEGLRALSRGTLDERLEEESVEIVEGALLDPTVLARVATIIRGELDELGLEFGNVSYEMVEANPIEMDVIFHVTEGSRVNIREVRFVGNDHFSQWELTRVLKKSRPTWIFSWVQKDNIYSSTLLDEDRAELERFYAAHGFLRVSVRDPIVETIEVDPLFKSRHVEAVITIPIREGIRYRINEITFSGATVMREEFLRAFFQLREGDLYDREAIEKSIEELQEAYYSRGYINAFIEDRITYIPERLGYVDLEIAFNEGDLYHIRRIEFEGNRATRDKVLRRNIFVFEQQPFNYLALRDSLRRLNQLGFFGSVEPEIIPNHDDKTIDLNISVTETGRNSIQFGGGYSGIEGAFFNFAFSTSNFWGQGQTISLMVQSGARNENYQISFFDPWLFDRPVGAGVTFFSRSFEFQDFISKGQGGRANISYRLSRWISLYLEYRFELVEVRNPADFPFGSSIFFPEGRTATGSVTPTLMRNTVDHPLLPTRGHRDTLSLEYGAKIFGGDFSFLKMIFEHISNFPLTSRNIVRFRGQVGYAKLLGETAELPVFERFFMGGENTLRGYELRTVGPRDEYGRIIGGTSSLLFNFEYAFLISREIRVVPFVDMGNAFAGGINVRDLHYSAGVEMRFFVPVMNIPFRFIIARPLNPEPYHRTSSFLFTIGSIF